MWTSNTKKIYIFYTVITIIGLILGLIFLLSLTEANKEIIFLNINEWIQSIKNGHINSIISHIIILSSLFILSLIIIGFPLNIFLNLYNGFSIGFIIASLTTLFGVKGFLYGIIFIIITKAIYLFFSFILTISNSKYCIINIKSFFKTFKFNKDHFSILCQKNLLCIGIIISYDILLYFIGSKILTIFNFLIN